MFFIYKPGLDISSIKLVLEYAKTVMLFQCIPGDPDCLLVASELNEEVLASKNTLG